MSKFASDLFEVHLRFGERDGQEFPVLEVEPGVRSPVASKRELVDPQDTSKKLVKMHAVYVRSLSANGTASTSEAKHGDWAELTSVALTTSRPMSAASPEGSSATSIRRPPAFWQRLLALPSPVPQSRPVRPSLHRKSGR